MGIYFGGQEYSKVYARGREFIMVDVGGNEYFDSTPAPTGPTHTFSFNIQNNGYNGPLGRGRIADGSSFSFNTPGGKSVTVQHCRAVGSGINFTLSGAATDLADFPTRIVVTKTSGGEVERTFEPRANLAPRTISAGVRLDYDPTSGANTDVFQNNQDVTVQLYYT